MNVPQISPELLKKFPHVHKKPYPRMMTQEVNGKLVPHKLSNGRPVIVKDESEEQKFLASINKSKISETEKAAPVTAVAIEEPVTSEDVTVAAPEKRRGRPPKLPQALED